MYLKSIEVHGFKSFAKKINFEFHEGITGIVGPNGSGKSNVADAVRWVFGEQRAKQLRGGSMQDVIFSGTEMRKPLSYASVAITLDNSDKKLSVDYEEVTVARKLYRSGESEYSINGVICRLKDVNELFYDTGIGKEGYSIIGQGQIDQILSGKPEDRRELFDEAAGIVKFKKRKNMSLKKLNDERANLLRVSDILSVLEKQVGPLERQSIVARQYLEYKEQLKVYDINMFLLDADRIREQIKELDSKLEILSNDFDQATIAYESTKEEYTQAEDEMEIVEDAIEQSRKQLNETNILKQQLEGKIEVLKEQINTVRANEEHISGRISSILSDIENRKDSKKQLISESQVLKTSLENKQDNANKDKIELQEVQSKIQELNNKIDNDKQLIMQLLKDRATTEAKIGRYDTLRENGEQRKEQLENNLVTITDEKKDLDTLISSLELAKKDTDLKVEKAKQNIRETEENIKNLQSEVADQSNRLRYSETAYHQDNSRLESIKNMTERYDGYGNAIRKVMEKKNEMPGLLGVVADIIKTEKTYEVAMETALGGSIQNIVTDNDITAKKMIQHLKQNRLGRATFLPLSSVKGGINIRYPEALKEAGVIGVASDVAIVDAEYKKLAESLLGRTIIVESIDVGLALAKKYQHSLRMVSVEGDLINPGGSLTGGAFKNSSNLLGRRREVEELEKKVKVLRDEMNSIEVAIEEAKKNRTIGYTVLEEAKQASQSLSVEQNTVNIRLEQAKSKLEHTNKTYNEMASENQEIDNQMNTIDSSKGSIDDELSNSHKGEEQLRKDIQHNQEELAHLKEDEIIKIENSESSKLLLNEIQQKCGFSIQNINRIDAEIENLESELNLLDKNKGNTSQGVKEKQDEIEKNLGQIEVAKELVLEIDTQLKSDISKKEALSVKHKDLIDTREQKAKLMSELDKEKYRLDGQKETKETDELKLTNYMWDEYELTYNAAMEVRNEDLTDIQFLRKEIHRIKSSIKELGSINVNAIEEYKQISEEYEFLRDQHADLIEAEQALMGIIAELDQAMRVQFKEQFELIAAEYDKVFKQLFGGGKGTLELEFGDGDDVLEAGVKIVAQPPGKKLQNMMQLSGGEKALTAISLLFAIQNLKPSPFCLLDEIEAALDDSNVVRFAQYLHKLTEHTQFIVITHRRGTMTASDRLYGITMQEKGVSTLVSVDLLEDELEE